MRVKRSDFAVLHTTQSHSLNPGYQVPTSTQWYWIGAEETKIAANVAEFSTQGFYIVYIPYHQRIPFLPQNTNAHNHTNAFNVCVILCVEYFTHWGARVILKKPYTTTCQNIRSMSLGTIAIRNPCFHRVVTSQLFGLFAICKGCNGEGASVYVAKKRIQSSFNMVMENVKNIILN